jgi:hypothetical protein
MLRQSLGIRKVFLTFWRDDIATGVATLWATQWIFGFSGITFLWT